MVKPRTYGRMGNFLFQAASAMGYAWRHQMPFTLPNTTNHAVNNPIYLQHLARPWDPSLRVVTIKEHTHGYQELPFQDRWRGFNIQLDGYWQTEKYFKEFRDRIIQTFAYPWSPRFGTVSVHVRRTDYLTLTYKHPPVPVSWIEAAMATFQNGYQFIFFSDDIAWCKETFGHRKDVSFSEGHNEVDDLVAMSCCEHHVCSASTFSWWGAWLNQNPKKRIIMPRNWFQPGYRKTDTKDIVPLEWERL